MNSHIMQKIPLLIIICFSFPLFVFGQTSASSGIYYISGIVVDEQTKDSIPYVRIQVNHTKTGAMTNSEGFFRIPVGLLDTLHFTHIGYEKSSFIVRDYLEKYQGSLDQDILVVKYMRKTDYYLDEVTIFPYDSPEEIRVAIQNMEVPKNTPQQIAEGNLSPEIMQILMQSLPMDGGEKAGVGRRMSNQAYQTKNLLPTASISPIAVFRSLKSIVQSVKKQKQTNLNDW